VLKKSRRRRRNPSRHGGLPGFKEFTGPQLVAAAASAILIQQSFVGSTMTWQDLLQRRNDGTLDLATLRAGYIPPALTGLTIVLAMSIGTKSVLPIAAGLVAAAAMLWSYEMALPPEVRLDPVSAVWYGFGYLPSSRALAAGQGGGRLLPRASHPRIIDDTRIVRVLEAGA